MGDHPEHLAALVGGDVRNVVVIANALDDAPADVRRSGLERELAALADLGFDGVEGHPETAAMDLVVARYQAEGVSYRPLRDGQALLINGPDTKIV
jgi:hypothetical protein